MSRRFETRKKYSLPLTLSNSNGLDQVNGTILDISATHFRAKFDSPLPIHKRFRFSFMLTSQEEVSGIAKIEPRYTRRAIDKHTYVFLIENLVSGCDRILLEIVSNELRIDSHERRQSGDNPGYKKNRRTSDRDTTRIDRPHVVITGIGVVASNAIGKAAFWGAIQSQLSGIRLIKSFDTSQFPVKFGAEVSSKSLSELVPRKKARHMSRATQLGWLASKLAIEDAEINLENENRDRVGVAMGTTLGPLDWAFEQFTQHSKGYLAQHPYTIAAGSANAVSGEICVEYGLRGPSMSFSQGCSSSSMAIAQGLEFIQSHKADVMLVGGADAPLNSAIFGAFVRSGMLAKSAPAWNSNVILKENCNGATLGEGGCVLILESYDHAIQRGAPIYGEVLSSGSASEGYHMIFADPSGRGTARAVQEAISNAGVSADSIDLVMGHFAGIEEAYEIEISALRRVIGRRFEQIPVTNVKPLIGYTQGACGAFEVAAACLAFQESVRWITYGRSCPPVKATNVLVNCVGFGGKNLSLILRGVAIRQVRAFQ